MIDKQGTKCADIMGTVQQLLNGWRRGVVVSGIRHMNEVNARRARLVPGMSWMGDSLRADTPSRYVTISQLDQLSLASLRGR